MISKYMFETEKLTNMAFAKLVESIERSPESRKLELNGYLTKPTTRLGRYNLLLREILKHTPEDHPDCKTIPKVMHLINGFLERVNEESGRTENKFSLKVLEEKLSWKKGPVVNQEIVSKIMHAKRLKKRANTSCKKKKRRIWNYFQQIERLL